MTASPRACLFFAVGRRRLTPAGLNNALVPGGLAAGLDAGPGAEYVHARCWRATGQREELCSRSLRSDRRLGHSITLSSIIRSEPLQLA